MKNLAASVQARLAQRRVKTGEDFNMLLVRFSLERLLYRLSRSQYREQFILKGAMLFALWEPTLHRVGKAIVPLQVDVGFGDALPVPPEEITFPVLLDMSAPKLMAYSRETVIAEKLEAIVELGMLNTRFKDYFDLHYLAHKFSFDGALLSKAIAGTFERRGTSFPDGLPVGLTQAFGNDAAKIRGWGAFWRKTGPKAEAPTLEAVIQLLVSFLELPLGAAEKGQPFRASWNSNRWVK